MRIFLIALLLFTSGCHAHNPIRSLEKNLGVSDLKSFKRNAKQERWDLKDNPTWNRTLILESLTQLGFIEEIKPKKNHYASAVLLGATGPRMKERIDFLVQVWREGTRFNRIVFLTGDRDLSPIDTSLRLGKAKNETQLFKQLWAQTSLPKDLKKLPQVWIDAPKINHTRPTTVSTIETWKLQENLEHQDLLAFSNQPLVWYQQCALLNYLPKSTHVETVGPKAIPDTLIAVYLDALASCLEFCPIGSEFQNRLSAL